MIESKGHKITPIDGDLVVSRNAEIGGDADIHGKARVAGSLKVEGFLDAPNIKGAVKGLFVTEEELKREYTNPRPGWCAIVLADNGRGFLYLAKNREWEKQSEEAQPFDFIVDSISVFASKKEFTEETQRAQMADNILLQKIVDETERATESENEIKKNAVKFDRIGITEYADKLKLMAATIDGDEVRYIDIPAATETKAGVVSAEDKKNFVKSITWNNDTDPSNMNDFVIAGVYNIKGERTRIDDNLPVLNIGGGHTFNARLTVLDSSINGSGEDDDKCITQVLSFSNRLGQGEVYIRTGKGASLDYLTWEKWSTLQRNVNVDAVTSLDHLVDNGIYSGVYAKNDANIETFVLIVINNYALAGINNLPKSISQFKYSVSLGGSFSKYETRVGTGVNDWGEWEILNKNEISSMISAEIKKVTDGIEPEKIDSIKDIVAWIDAHGGEVTAIYEAIQENTKAIENESGRATTAEAELNQKILTAARYDGNAFSSTADEVKLTTTGVNINKQYIVNLPAATTEKAGVMTAEDKVKLNASIKNVEVSPDVDEVELDLEVTGNMYHVPFPSATTEKAGVMSAADKVTLDAIPKDIEKIKDGDTIVGQAREIHSRNGKTVPDSFLIRTTAGSGTIGDGVASLKSVGGNIVKNLVDGTFKSGWSGTTVNLDKGINHVKPAVAYGGGGYFLTPISGHKYYVSAYVFQKDNKLVIMRYGASTYYNRNIGGWQLISHIGTNVTDTAILYQCANDIVDFFITKPTCIDLTEMFGAGNEPDKATCDKLFGTMDALPQGLNIANPNEFKSTGFNQFNPDNVLEGKAIVDNAIGNGDKKIAVIPCLPCKVGVGENNGYCIHGDFGDDINVYLTPLNPMDVDGELYMHKLTKDATTDTYVPQIKGYMLVEVPTTANLCAHFLWSEDKCKRDSYEPYFESKVELPDIPQMSEWGLAGVLGYNDEIDFNRGVYIKRVEKIVLNGSENWTKRANNKGFFNDKMLSKSAISLKTITNINFIQTFNDSEYGRMSIGNKAVYINYSESVNSLSVEGFKEYLAANPIVAYYALQTPEEYPLPKVDNSYISSDYGVEQFDSVVPCNANNLYYMRSLAGETRNFLDRLYSNTAKTDAKEVADYITNFVGEVADISEKVVWKTENLYPFTTSERPTTSVYLSNGSLGIYAKWAKSEPIVISNKSRLIGQLYGFNANGIEIPSIVFLDIDKNFIRAIPAIQGVHGVDTNTESQSIPPAAAYFVIQGVTASEYDEIEKYIYAEMYFGDAYRYKIKEGLIEPSIPYDLLVPKIVYNVGNDISRDVSGFPRNYSACLYLDNMLPIGLTDEPNVRFLDGSIMKSIPCYEPPMHQIQGIGGGWEKPLMNNGESKTETDVVLNINNEGHEQSFVIKNRSVLNSATSNKKAGILIIGDSITFGQNAFFEGNSNKANYTLLLREFFKKDGLQNGSGFEFDTIGTISHIRQFEYKGNSYTINAYNEGYSGTTMQNTGLYKNPKFLDDAGVFSFQNWLNKYRTKDTNGNQLYFNAQKGTTGIGGNFGYYENGEISEYKIGTEVTDVTKVNVYEPTHVFLFHGTNAQISKNEYDGFIAKVREVFPNAIIGLGVPHVAGTYYPREFPNYTNCEMWNPMLNFGYGQRHYVTAQSLDAIASDNSYEQNRIYVVPTYFVNPAAKAIPAMAVSEPMAEFIDSGKVYEPKGQAPDVHVGGMAHAAYAYQLYAWIKWTLL